MGYQWLLFGFDGRINRGRIWLASLMMLGCMILLGVLTVAVGKLLGISVTSFSMGTGDIFAIVDPETYRSLASADRFGMFVRVAATPLFLWPYLAISIKRLHDRNRSGMWMIPFFAVPGLYSQFGDRMGDSMTAILLATAIFAVAVWGGIELYFLKGTRGDNRFGDDPLAVDPVDTRPAWDQRSEIEFVPVSAGPSPGPHGNRGHD